MMKTPDEIKKGLECCSGAGHCFGECPYYTGNPTIECIRHKSADALAYIRQLEAANAELLTKVEQLTAKCHQLERERDAAVDDMATVIYNGAEIVCQFCKHRDEHKCAQICDFAFKGFEWRGVKEE